MGNEIFEEKIKCTKHQCPYHSCTTDNCQFEEVRKIGFDFGRRLCKATCRTCENRQSWEVGSRNIQYCGVRKNNRTFNNLLKISVKDKACHLYKEEMP